MMIEKFWRVRSNSSLTCSPRPLVGKGKSRAVAGLIVLTLFATFGAQAAEEPHVSRILHFYGVPPALQPQIKHKFPFAFEREATLPEIDEIVRFLMKTGNFASVEAVERDRDTGGGRETAVVVTSLRRIQDIQITGANAISASDAVGLLGIEKGQVFERKHLLNAAEELRRIYEERGYHEAKVEIDFDLPNDSEVIIKIAISEGSPVRVGEVAIDAPGKLSDRLNSIGRSLRGKILTQDELGDFQKKVGDYLSSNAYLTARLSTPSVTYNTEHTIAKLSYVVEQPWKFDFVIHGNHYFSDSSIIDTLEEEKLSGAVSSPAPDMAEKIRRMYQAAGYANIEVNFAEKLDENKSRLTLTFDIHENPRVQISKIQVTGALSHPESYYYNFIKSQSTPLIAKGYYNRKDVDDAAKKLITELQNQGYLRAKFQSQRTEFSADNKKVAITLVLEEGPLTQIRQIRFEGVNAYPKTQLAEILKIKTGAALGLRELEDSIAAIKDLYHNEGFLEMKILNENEQNRMVTYNEGNTQATVEFQIYEGPRVIVSSIATQGNTFTKERVITRELPFKVGDTLTPAKIDETIYRLQKLNLFSKVTLRTLEEGTNIAERTVIVEVIEKDPGSFITRFGVINERNYATFRNADTIAYNNLDGTGRGVALRAEPKYSLDPRVSYIEHIITLSYLEPYIFGDRNRGRISLVHEVLLYEIDPLAIGSQTTMQTTNTLGFTLERELSRHIRLSYNAYSLSNESEWDRFSYQTKEVVNVGKLGPMVEFDYRDSAFNPTKGSYSTVQFEYADPNLGSSQDQTITVQFIKTTIGTAHYTPLFNKKGLILVNQERAGYLANINRDVQAGVPAQEAFFLGGRSTIRGFVDGDLDEKIPNWHDLGLANSPEIDYRYFHATADSYFVLIKTDLWFPIYGSIGGTIFYDGGNVFVNQPNVQLGLPWRDSVGVGLRITTPVGPINLDVGFKLNRRLIQVATNGGYDIREAPFAVHISIGAL